MERTLHLKNRPCKEENESKEELPLAQEVTLPDETHSSQPGSKALLKEGYVLSFIIIMFSVGLIGHSFSPLLPLMKALTPFTLFIVGSSILMYFFLKEDKSFLIWAVIVYLFTLFIEIAGVKTGLIFGTYSYGEVLGQKLMEVPLIIGFNWMFIISGAIYIARRFYCRVLPSSLLAAALAVVFDVILEPAAIKLGYWQWEDGIIPLQNYAAWFMIAFLSALTYRKLKVRVKTKLLQHYFLVQFLFFMALLLVL